MPVTLGAQPEHGFDEPLGLMSDCHRRIEHFLGLLEKVNADCLGTPLTDEYRRAVEAALRYFELAAPRHTEDEERSLFPRLRELDRSEARNASEKLSALEADHAEGNILHAKVRSWFQRWLDDEGLDPAEQRKLQRSLGVLREMYRRHIAVEEEEIFPLAGAALSRDQLAQLGQEMAARRGLPAI